MKYFELNALIRSYCWTKSHYHGKSYLLSYYPGFSNYLELTIYYQSIYDIKSIFLVLFYLTYHFRNWQFFSLKILADQFSLSLTIRDHTWIRKTLPINLFFAESLFFPFRIFMLLYIFSWYLYSFVKFSSF